MSQARWLVTALLLAGCGAELRSPAGSDSDREGPAGPVLPPDPSRPDPVGLEVTQGPSGDIKPPQPEPEPSFRNRRRMDLDQLDAAIRTVTGGIGWEENGRNLFEDLAQTLGKPDYIQITDEDLSPSAMFQKFLDDAARSVCTRLMAEDAERPSDERTFFVDAQPGSTLSEQPDSVKRNLSQLLLRFHGRKVAVDGAEMEPWVWLMQSAEHVASDPGEVWRTLCVGLIIHPDFYTY